MEKTASIQNAISDALESSFLLYSIAPNTKNEIGLRQAANRYFRTNTGKKAPPKV